jgi:hypothetical protein
VRIFLPLILIMIMALGFVRDGAFAQSPDLASGQSSPKSTEPDSSGRPQDGFRRIPQGNLARRRVGTPIRPQQNATRRPRLRSGPEMNLRPGRSDGIGVAGRFPVSSNPNIRGGRAVQLSGTARPVTAPSSMVRHRSPNPPVVGGMAGSVRRNTGGIDGSRIKRGT